MKFAPILAGGALGLVLFTLATAKAVNPPRHFAPVDFTGIETLEVHANRSLTIEINSSAEPGMSYDDSTESRVRTRREGTRLVVNAELSGFTSFDIVVPTGVHRFVVDGGTIKSFQMVPEVEVLLKDGVYWEGDTQRLVLRDASDPARHSHDDEDDAACSCSPTRLNVTNGRIGELRVYSPHGDLTLGKPDEIGQVYAALGARGHVSLSNARRFDHIHMVPDDEPAAAVAPR